jgi:sugar phosphate isomerase/epimerase
MKLGLSSYAYGWAVGFAGFDPPCPLDAFGLIERTVSVGGTLLQLHDNVPLEQLSESALGDIRRAADDAGLELHVGTRGLKLKRIERYLEICRILRSGLLRVVMDDSGYEPDVACVISLLKEIAPKLGDVSLAIENHDRFTARTLRSIIESINHPNLVICLDTANSIGAGEGLQTVLEQLLPYTANAHIKDITIKRIDTKMGFNVAGCVAGEGILDIPDLIQQLAGSPHCESICLETWTPRAATPELTLADEADCVARSMSYLHKLLNHG